MNTMLKKKPGSSPCKTTHKSNKKGIDEMYTVLNLRGKYRQRRRWRNGFGIKSTPGYEDC